jgi:dienelactone hydrolase
MPPFVLSPAPVIPERAGTLDIYRPSGHGPWPAVLFVHGGPGRAEPSPRDWPVYRGYAAEVAARSVVAGVVDHCLIHGTTPALIAQADSEVTAAVDQLRAADGVDENRIALWFFSGSGLLVAPWLDGNPSWLRCIAATYPRFCPRDDLPPGIPAAVDAITRAPYPPVVLTRVGLERPELAEAVDAFIKAADTEEADTKAADKTVTVIDVPNGQHGFDCLDHTEESRSAVLAALDAVTGHLS